VLAAVRKYRLSAFFEGDISKNLLIEQQPVSMQAAFATAVYPGEFY
jgi:hypothetical protein